MVALVTSEAQLIEKFFLEGSQRDLDGTEKQLFPPVGAPCVAQFGGAYGTKSNSPSSSQRRLPSWQRRQGYELEICGRSIRGPVTWAE